MSKTFFRSLAVSVAVVGLGCSGLVPTERVVETAPDDGLAVEIAPAESSDEVVEPDATAGPAKGTGRLEVFWGSPAEGNAVWAEGNRMEYSPELGPHGTWYLNVSPGPYVIKLRDGVDSRTYTSTADVKVKASRYSWCDPELVMYGRSYEKERWDIFDCRHGDWPGPVDRHID